ncbi:MAG: hypothetical protein RBR70_02510 [Arcobacter sp.]|jgi:hypothetical protein|uniref:hypothetical protein n=1 Tax=Arcobacter sp. TaxID=1872629 RepID=UPI002590372D|nr:hypothetical protein [Arcobacter sp.]MDD3009150.1 hypothetical protein [Arcobacter sp.]MDX9815132.1 hypothetical protein [Sulfurimonadaceae bacterium]MDY3203928.1 hypothetical protein [Arcobacter sp.]
MRLIKNIFISFLFLGMVSLWADSSCYDIYKTSKKPDIGIERAVFVLIDETTLFNQSLQEQIIKNTLSKIAPANYIYIGKFSAFIDNHYNEKIFEFKLDIPMSSDERYYERKDTLSKIDKCLKDQHKYVAKQVVDGIGKSFLKPDDNISKSDILYALKDFGENVISKVEAKEKIVILASDMLENSTITSFYSKGTTRFIKSKEELKKIEKADLISNFDNSKVYIIGAGLISSKDNNKTYRDPKILSSLKDFWTNYFNKSNGSLTEMGQPSLKNEIQ